MWFKKEKLVDVETADVTVGDVFENGTEYYITIGLYQKYQTSFKLTRSLSLAENGRILAQEIAWNSSKTYFSFKLTFLSHKIAPTLKFVNATRCSKPLTCGEGSVNIFFKAISAGTIFQANNCLNSGRLRKMLQNIIYFFLSGGVEGILQHPNRL